jgi:hypothetical protein
VNWVGDLLAHWHGGDSGVVTLNAETGHGTGQSHLIAFSQGGHVVVIECSPDYQKSTIASVQMGSPGASHRVVSLQMQTIQERQALVITLDNGIAVVLYHTADSWSQNPV